MAAAETVQSVAVVARLRNFLKPPHPGTASSANEVAEYTNTILPEWYRNIYCKGSVVTIDPEQYGVSYCDIRDPARERDDPQNCVTFKYWKCFWSCFDDPDRGLKYYSNSTCSDTVKRSDGEYIALSQQTDLRSQVVSPLIKDVFNGYNLCIFAYGQSGSGKTYTMVGAKDGQNKLIAGQEGVIPAFSQMLMEQCKEKEAAEPLLKYTITCNMVEIYNNEPYNLLVPKWHSGANPYKLKTRRLPSPDDKSFLIFGFKEGSAKDEIRNLPVRQSGVADVFAVFLNICERHYSPLVLFAPECILPCPAGRHFIYVFSVVSGRPC